MLGAPPAFVLSQDQTLHRCIKSPKAPNQMKFVQADSEHLAFALKSYPVSSYLLFVSGSLFYTLWIEFLILLIFVPSGTNWNLKGRLSSLLFNFQGSVFFAAL